MWLLSSVRPQLKTDMDRGGCLQLACLSCPMRLFFRSFRQHPAIHHATWFGVSPEDTDPPKLTHGLCTEDSKASYSLLLGRWEVFD